MARRQIAACLEVLGIMALGWLLTRIVVQLLPVPGLEDRLAAAVAADRPDFFALALLATVPLIAQALCLLGPAELVSRWLRKESFLSTGASATRRTVSGPLVTGLAVFCFFALPLRALFAAHNLSPLGVEPSYWGLFDKAWDLGFWLFMAVGSFALIPVLEELFYRGYCQTRLERAFGGPAAVVGTSALFAAVHFQYYRPDVLNIGFLVSLFIVSIGIGIAYWSTRSLLAPIAIHALMNLPADSPWDLALVGTMVVAGFTLRHRIVLAVRALCRERIDLAAAPFLLVVPAFAAGMLVAPGPTLIVATGGLAVALWIGGRAGDERPS